MVSRAILGLALLSVSSTVHAQATPPKATQSTQRTMHIALADKVMPIPIRRVKGAIILTAQISGQQVNVLFDNGSETTVIDQSFARSHGMPVKTTGAGMNTGLSVLHEGLTEGAITLGNAVTINGQLMTADLGGVSRALDMPVSAILGRDALMPFVVVINPQQAWIAFGLPGQIDVKSHANVNSAPTADLNTAKALLPKLAPAIIPFGSDFSVKAMINGEPVSLLIDYGHTGAITLRDDIWQRVIPAGAATGKSSTTFRADGQKLNEQIGIAHDLQLGAITAKDVPVLRQTPMRDRSYEGLLGLGILGNTTTILEMPKRQLWVFPVGQDVGVATPDSAKTSQAGQE